MRSYALVSLALALLVIVNHVPAGGGKKSDLKKLEGTWTMVSGEEKGKPLPEDVIKSASLKISDDEHTVKVGDATMVGTHKLDPSKTPKTIDVSDTEGPYKGKMLKGIYKLGKGEFTVCFSEPGAERPTEFTTKSGTGVILHVWARKK